MPRAALPILMLLTAAAAAQPPNIVIVLADDMGYGDASCYGGTVFETPNIDRLAAEGLRFTDFHSNGANCSPTRAALMTGRYQQRAGIPGVVYANPERNRHHGLHGHEVTLAELLRKSGYATALFGKWHLGYREEFNPVHHGFDTFRGFVSGNVDYKAYIDGQGIYDWWDGAELDREVEGYTTDLITEHAVEFIERHREQPFCLIVAHAAPHYPYQGPDDPPMRVERTGKPGKLWNDRDPEHVPGAYAAMMRSLDDGVGAIVKALRRCELAERTLVFFTSDNGATQHGSCGPLRGNKGSMWEGGHRVPAIAWWPGTVEPGVTDQTAIGMDLMPTALELAGAAPPEGHALDGRSLGGLLLRGEELGERTLFWQNGQRFAVRKGASKLVIEFRNGQQALFDLETDLAESEDLTTDRPSQVAEMRGLLSSWRAAVAEGATVQPSRPR